MATIVLSVSTLVAMAVIAVNIAPRFGRAPVTLPVQDTMWDSFREPAVSSIEPGGPVELGTVMRPAARGVVAGVRFYRLHGDAGPHVGHVWSIDGERLATVAFAATDGTGWQDAQLPEPVPVDADEAVVVSYFSPTGSAMATGEGFLRAGAPGRSYSRSFYQAATVRPRTNLYRLGEAGFPSEDAGGRAFWVDVLFVPETFNG